MLNKGEALIWFLSVLAVLSQASGSAVFDALRFLRRSSLAFKSVTSVWYLLGAQPETG